MSVQLIEVVNISICYLVEVRVLSFFVANFTPVMDKSIWLELGTIPVFQGG